MWASGRADAGVPPLEEPWPRFVLNTDSNPAVKCHPLGEPLVVRSGGKKPGSGKPPALSNPNPWGKA